MMAFREYGNYDGLGLAELVRKKQVTASELLDEAIARTARVDPADQCGGREALRLCAAANRQRTSGRPLHRRAVSAQGSRSPRGHADDVRRQRIQGQCRGANRHAGAALSRIRGHDLRQELEPGIRIDADHRAAAARPDPKSLEPGALLAAALRAARRRRSPRAFFPSRMPATAAVRSGYPPRRPACSD